MSETRDQIMVTRHAVGTNFGDHGETVITAVAVRPGETVRELMDRLIEPTRPYARRDYTHFVTLRFVEPVEPRPDMDVPL